MKSYIIKYKNNEFLASKYQSKIFDNIEHGVGNIVISAAAGSSKTTTIVNCIKLIDCNKKILFIAFNKEIVNNINNQINNYKNCFVSTFHKMGFLFLCENIEKAPIVNEYKYTSYISDNLSSLSDYKNNEVIKVLEKTYISNITKLVEYSRYYLAFSVKEIKTIAKLYGIELINDECYVVKKILKWGKDNINEIDFTDMIWLPNVLNYTTKKYKYNWVLIDESQDTSIAEQKLIEKCFTRGTRFVVVGDENQQINVWCGSSKEAINNFFEYPNTKQFKLPICYRCPKKIVELAKKYSDNIEIYENAIDGEINYDVSRFSPTNGDMVLCRITSPLIKLYLEYLRINKESYIKGIDIIKNDYINLCNINNVKIIDKNCVLQNSLFYSLYIRLFEMIDKAIKEYKITEEDAIMIQNIYSFYDAIQGLKILSEGLNTVKELKEKINIIFSNQKENGVQLSTVHKAKGLESDNVYILQSSLMPMKSAKRDWEIQSEKNLIYVAITRAKKTLNYIKEDNIFYQKNKQYNIEYILNDLNDKKRIMKYNVNNAIRNQNKETIKTTENNVIDIQHIKPKNSKRKMSRFSTILN